MKLPLALLVMIHAASPGKAEQPDDTLVSVYGTMVQMPAEKPYRQGKIASNDGDYFYDKNTDNLTRLLDICGDTPKCFMKAIVHGQYIAFVIEADGVQQIKP